MIYKLLGVPLCNFIESFVDKVIRDSVAEPAIGSVVSCDMGFGYADHSGIYIGNQQIVHLLGNGEIEIVSPKAFVSNTSALSIYVSCRDSLPVGSSRAAALARSQVGNRRTYSLLTDNCHRFSSGCLSGDFDNSDCFFWMLKSQCSKVLNANTWRVWDTSLFD